MPQQASFYCLQCKQPRLFTRNGTNHVLHLLLTLFLCGLWLPVWIIIAISEGSNPYYCSMCGYSGTGSYLANPMRFQQKQVAIQNKQIKQNKEQSNITEQIGQMYKKNPVFFIAYIIIFCLVSGIIIFLSVNLFSERNTINTTTNTSIQKNQNATETKEALQLKSYLAKTYSNMSWHRQINYIQTFNDAFYVRTYLSYKDQNAIEICNKVKTYVFGAKNDSSIKEVIIQSVIGDTLITLRNSSEGCGKPDIITKDYSPR